MKQLTVSEPSRCNKCKLIKPPSEFSNASGGNYKRTSCRSCESDLSKVRKALKDTVDPPKEDHTCPICKRNEAEAEGLGGKRNGPWALDHCHNTGSFRGWLCHSCNRVLGQLKDDTSLLERIRGYLHG